MTTTSDTKKLTGWELLKVNLTLGFSKSLLVFPTQWLQVIMRRQQSALIDKSQPRVLTARQALNEVAPHAKTLFTQPLHVIRTMRLAGEQAALLNVIAPRMAYMNGFIKGNPIYSLFKGALPGAGKEALKNGLYKGAVIVEAPNFAARLLEATSLTPNTSPMIYAVARPVLAGAMAAATDVIVGGALESWATQSATSHGKNANASYLRDVQQEPTLAGKIRRAYRGFGPALGKSGVAFTTMYAANDSIKTGVASFYGIQINEKPWYATLTAATLSGSAVALTSSVPDIAKTWSQMPNPTQQNLMSAIAANYRTYGLKGMFAGVPVKSVMAMFGWGLTYIVTQGDAHRPTATPKASSTAIVPSKAALFQPAATQSVARHAEDERVEVGVTKQAAVRSA